MSMYCQQCQETAQNKGCTVAGVCGKKEDTANLQDLLIYVLQGISIVAEKGKTENDRNSGLFLSQALFVTITNANFDNDKIIALIKKGILIRDELKGKVDIASLENVHDSVTWTADSKEDFLKKATEIGIISYSANEDIRSLNSDCP